MKTETKIHNYFRYFFNKGFEYQKDFSIFALAKTKAQGSVGEWLKPPVC